MPQLPDRVPAGLPEEAVGHSSAAKQGVPQDHVVVAVLKMVLDALASMIKTGIYDKQLAISCLEFCGLIMTSGVCSITDRSRSVPVPLARETFSAHFIRNKKHP